MIIYFMQFYYNILELPIINVLDPFLSGIIVHYPIIYEGLYSIRWCIKTLNNIPNGPENIF